MTPVSEAYNEDNLTGMRALPDNFFDLVIDDPPYFSGPERRKYYGNKINKIGVRRVDYDVTPTWGVPGKEYFDELFRVSKHQIIWGCNYFDYPFGPGRIVWDKVNGSSSFSDCEIAYCSLHESTRLFRFMWNGMLQGKSALHGHIMQGNKKLNEKRIHPTQKPIILYKWILANYAEAGDVIGDPHMGSQSSRIAAHDMGYDYYGWELDERHFARGCKRFKLASAQSRLQFNPQP